MRTLHRVWALVRSEPARAAAVATVVLAWLATAGVPDEIVGGLGTLLAALLGWPIRDAVTPVANVAGTVRAAAEKAALDTAQRLDEEIVGPAGQLTDRATGVVIEAAGDAAHDALNALGVRRKYRDP